MNMYYVDGTVLEKKVEVTDVRAVNARDITHLKEICDASYVRWSARELSGPYAFGPYKLSSNWR